MRSLTAILAAMTLHAQVTLSKTDYRPEVALQAAIRTETVDGNLTAAIRQYDAISKSGNRKAAAQALVRMGRCYEKLGDSQASVFLAKRNLAAVTRKPAAVDLPAGGDGKAGWYNGDWCQCARGLRNQMIGDVNYALVDDDFNKPAVEWKVTVFNDVHYYLVYDDFVVPAAGWTVIGVFSNDRLIGEGVTQAYWEIRTEMSEGQGGKVVASKTSPATLNLVLPASDGSVEYEVRVDGLNVKLAPGRYWLTVAPVLKQGYSYVEATSGTNAVGNPAGNNGNGYVDFPRLNRHFMRTGKASEGVYDSSQGVRIASEK